VRSRSLRRSSLARRLPNEPFARGHRAIPQSRKPSRPGRKNRKVDHSRILAVDHGLCDGAVEDATIAQPVAIAIEQRLRQREGIGQIDMHGRDLENPPEVVIGQPNPRARRSSPVRKRSGSWRPCVAPPVQISTCSCDGSQSSYAPCSNSSHSEPGRHPSPDPSVTQILHR
jgi:hypothetical protein